MLARTPTQAKLATKQATQLALNKISYESNAREDGAFIPTCRGNEPITDQETNHQETKRQSIYPRGSLEHRQATSPLCRPTP